ncbi:hypothetical protein GCM10023175_05230 [Pseudonocardia xishanensis]|uniref:Uncharacterized protein n=1 Tax=Pseudonocardia xishanensis TaxID=630995 RepID=A0ABP8RF18_9PSEU
MPHAVQVDLGDGPPHLGRDRPDGPGGDDTGVRHDGVQPTERRHSFVDHGADRLRVADIGDSEQGPGTLPLDRLRRLLEIGFGRQVVLDSRDVAADVEPDDVDARRRAGSRGCDPDPGRLR